MGLILWEMVGSPSFPSGSTTVPTPSQPLPPRAAAQPQSTGSSYAHASATVAANQLKAWKGILAAGLAAAAQTAHAAPADGEGGGDGDDDPLANLPTELEDAPVEWGSQSALASHTRTQLQKQIDALGSGHAPNLVVRGPDIMRSSGEPHECYASTHSYCVLALHFDPLATLVRDPAIPDKVAVLCPRCSSGRNTAFKGYLWAKLRRLPQPRGVLIVLNGKYMCKDCPQGAHHVCWGSGGMN